MYNNGYTYLKKKLELVIIFILNFHILFIFIPLVCIEYEYIVYYSSTVSKSKENKLLKASTTQHDSILIL